MRLLEYQSKKLLSGFGLIFTKPTVVESVQEAQAAVARIGLPAVLKAQVPFGGRGKAGAVKFAETVDAAVTAAKALLGVDLRGTKVNAISIEPKLDFDQALYVGIAWDTVEKSPIALLSLSGGVDVESSPADGLACRSFDPWVGLVPYQGRQMGAKIGLKGRTLVRVGDVLAKLSEAFIACDGVTMEINPMVVTANGELVGLDAHVEIEDDALYRQSEKLESLGELAPTVAGRPPTPLELEAQRIDAIDHRGVAGRVVEFDGALALLIGGGGASLTIFDAIQRHGGQPANYCEVGGNPTEEKVAALTALLLTKPGVKKMAVIMNVVNNTRADVIARGVIMGAEKAGKIPSEAISVFRVPGNWEREARDIMAAAGIEAHGREISLDEAARLAVERNLAHVA
ncbi:MAG: succinate--CoA ligase [Candidatus Poribacteria bacterium]|nr:succinate--CoA ligase [Candidatus Poribacteria bacterium]